MARFCAGLGEKDKAFEWLEKDSEERGDSSRVSNCDFRREASEVLNPWLRNKTTSEKSRTALRTVETSSYTYLHVLGRSPSPFKLFKVLLSWPLTR